MKSDIRNNANYDDKSSIHHIKDNSFDISSFKSVNQSNAFLEELPIERKMEEFLNSNNKSTEFVAMRLLIFLFIVLTVLASIVMFSINDSFNSEMVRLYEATNLTMIIGSLTGRINLLSLKTIETTAYFL